jgi:hypothetical protein
MYITRLIPLFVVAGLLGFASDAVAFCSGDSWASATAAVVIRSNGTVDASASASINHTPNAHPTCFGDIQAQSRIVGHPTCISNWAYTGHLPDGTGTSVFALKEGCFVGCGFNFYGGGEFSWNGVEDERFEESAAYFIGCSECEPPPGGCTIEGCIWSYEECACVDCCPLVFDTTGKGYKLTSADRGVWFDINADGHQDEISWTDPSRDVAFLVFDRNANNLVDHGEELFGNVTPMPPGSEHERAAHGFDALKSLEDPSYGTSVKDGTIDARDAAYHRLMFWIDRNHNGVSEPSELRKAGDVGLIAVETRFRQGKRVDEFGNEYRLRGISWWQKRERLDARLFYDVWFVPNR